MLRERAHEGEDDEKKLITGTGKPVLILCPGLMDTGVSRRGQNWLAVWSQNYLAVTSVMGSVKTKLKKLGKTVVLDRSLPTTKLCTRCGEFHDEMKLWDRTFRCSCGTEMDRDVHAARNMVWFYENNVGVGRTNLKRVEMEALVNSVLKAESTNFNL